jgi:hypothetical protein
MWGHGPCTALDRLENGERLQNACQLPRDRLEAPRFDFDGSELRRAAGSFSITLRAAAFAHVEADFFAGHTVYEYCREFDSNSPGSWRNALSSATHRIGNPERPLR